MAFGYYPQPAAPGPYGGYYSQASQQAAQGYPPTYPPAQAPQQTPRQPDMLAYWTQGIEPVKTQYVEPGTTAVFFDIENPIVYFKTVEQGGKPKPLRICDYSEREIINRPAPISAAPEIEYATKEEFRALAEKVAELSERRGGRKTTKGDEADG